MFAVLEKQWLITSDIQKSSKMPFTFAEIIIHKYFKEWIQGTQASIKITCVAQHARTASELAIKTDLCILVRCWNIESEMNRQWMVCHAFFFFLSDQRGVSVSCERQYFVSSSSGVKQKANVKPRSSEVVPGFENQYPTPLTQANPPFYKSNQMPSQIRTHHLWHLCQFFLVLASWIKTIHEDKIVHPLKIEFHTCVFWVKGQKTANV